MSNRSALSPLGSPGTGARLTRIFQSDSIAIAIQSHLFAEVGDLATSRRRIGTRQRCRSAGQFHQGGIFVVGDGHAAPIVAGIHDHAPGRRCCRRRSCWHGLQRFGLGSWRGNDHGIHRLRSLGGTLRLGRTASCHSCSQYQPDRHTRALIHCPLLLLRLLHCRLRRAAERHTA